VQQSRVAMTSVVNSENLQDFPLNDFGYASKSKRKPSATFRKSGKTTTSFRRQSTCRSTENRSLNRTNVKVVLRQT